METAVDRYGQGRQWRCWCSGEWDATCCGTGTTCSTMSWRSSPGRSTSCSRDSFTLPACRACAFFYEDILKASPTPVRLFPALRAYLVSHLGKYVPGKAMVGGGPSRDGRPPWCDGLDRGDRHVLRDAGHDGGRGLIAARAPRLAGLIPSALTLPRWGRRSTPVLSLAVRRRRWTDPRSSRLSSWHRSSAAWRGSSGFR